MDRQRFTATNELRATLKRRERSGAWLARKIGVSQQLMSFVMRGQRTLSHDAALRASAVLDEPVGFLFAPVATSIVESGAALASEAA